MYIGLRNNLLDQQSIKKKNKIRFCQVILCFCSAHVEIVINGEQTKKNRETSHVKIIISK